MVTFLAVLLPTLILIAGRAYEAHNAPGDEPETEDSAPPITHISQCKRGDIVVIGGQVCRIDMVNEFTNQLRVSMVGGQQKYYSFSSNDWCK